MADAQFEHPRLAQLYDPLDAVRSDLDGYLALVEEVGARTVLDVGCGTGTFACLLARRGVAVTGLDPAAASLEVAKAKAGGDRVQWIHGDSSALPPLQVDLATMTGNVAQVFVTDDDWSATLTTLGKALRPGGRLVFESRVPEDEAWRKWTPEDTRCRTVVAGVGPVDYWVDVFDVCVGRVSFRSTFAFEVDGTVLTSDSTLRFRSREELSESLVKAGLIVREVREAPDRPGREFVFIAQRPEG